MCCRDQCQHSFPTVYHAASSILVNIPSAADDDDMHISRNCVPTLPAGTSNIRMVSGFIFSTPESDKPLMANAILHAFHKILKIWSNRPLIMHAVLVRLAVILCNFTVRVDVAKEWS